MVLNTGRPALRPLRFVFRTALVSAALTTGFAQAQTVFSASGTDAASITPTVDAFRSALGVLNPNSVGSFGSGRREINWDGVPDNFSAPNALPANFFNANSPRGVVFSTPGSSLQVSADDSNPTATPTQFGNIDPTYPGFFEPFSPQRLFTAIGSNIVDVSFFVPGSAEAALTSGFGVIFSDVDVANVTSISFFDATNTLLRTDFAPFLVGIQTFSFLGVDFDSAIVARVRITSGNQVLAAGNGAMDLVVMDDFIYGEPIAAIPEPEVHALMLAGLGLLAGVLRRRAVRRDPARG